jgi:hypothetical protein
MKKLFCLLVLVVGFTPVFSQIKINTWDLFATTKFESKYNEKLKEYLIAPNFPANLKAMVGKEMTIEGYYVPFTVEGGTYIVISKYPMSQCFFCGGGGPESVAEVNFAKQPAKFQVDDLITVKGKLKLNAEDLDHVNFILEDATLVSR